jgi:NAD kinase
VDGADGVPLGEGDRVVVQEGRAPLRLIRVFAGPFYETLRSKLGWRGRPRYADDREEEDRGA